MTQTVAARAQSKRIRAGGRAETNRAGAPGDDGLTWAHLASSTYAVARLGLGVRHQQQPGALVVALLAGQVERRRVGLAGGGRGGVRVSGRMGREPGGGRVAQRAATTSVCVCAGGSAPR